MIVSFKKNIKSFVFDEDHILMGRLRDIIIDPGNGKITGFWISTPSKGLQIARPSGIIQWSQHIIFARESLHDPEKASFWKPILEADTPIVNQTTYEGHQKKRLGKVTDLMFDPYTAHILQVVVKTDFFGFNKRIIDRTLIDRIDDSGVYLYDTKLPDGAEPL